MEERVVLVMSAARPIPTVRAGRIRLLKPDLPPDGSQPSVREKIMMSIRPSQKFGIEVPNKDVEKRDAPQHELMPVPPPRRIIERERPVQLK